MLNVGIIGATGYTGAELVRLLSRHPGVSLAVVTSRQHINTPYTDIYPGLSGTTDLVCEVYDVDRFCERVELAFTALPHQLPMAIVPELLQRGLKVIDLSADYRFRDVHVYETVYQPHASPDLCPQAVYGLSEIYAERIKGASLIGNPGCYPTSALLPIIPLVRNRLIDPDSIIIDAKSGVSGAGRSPALTTLFCEVNEGFKAYKIGEHRHTPEIASQISIEAGRSVQPTFVPHLVPLNRGMLTTVYAVPINGCTEKQIRQCLHDQYDHSPFVRLYGDGAFPNVSFVRGSNYCDIGMRIDPSSGRLIIVSAIDNLVKGAAGQAVQNMNLMSGFSETTGLEHSPHPV